MASVLACPQREAVLSWHPVAPKAARGFASDRAYLETIKASSEISWLFSNGERIDTPVLSMIINQKQHGHPGRVAFVAGKKLGNAVWRNSAKRRLRAIAREMGAPWVGYDVVFIAKRRTMTSSYSKVLGTCERALGEVLSPRAE